MKNIIFSFLMFVNISATAQDISYNKKIVDTLTSATFWGRGYTKNGMENAANFLQNEFKKLGLKPLDGKKYLQKFTVPANTFPGKMEVSVNGKKLVPGVDYLVGVDSKGLQAIGELEKQDSATYLDRKNKIIVSLEKKINLECFTKSRIIYDNTIR